MNYIFTMKKYTYIKTSKVFKSFSSKLQNYISYICNMLVIWLDFADLGSLKLLLVEFFLLLPILSYLLYTYSIELENTSRKIGFPACAFPSDIPSASAGWQRGMYKLCAFSRWTLSIYSSKVNKAIINNRYRFKFT